MDQRIFIVLAFLIYTLVLVYIALISRKKQIGLRASEFVNEFYTAGRGSGAFVVAFMLAAGLCSAGTFVGSPAVGYDKGLAWVPLINWQNFMNLMVLGVVGKKIGIVARRINARSFLSIFSARYEHSKTIVLTAGVALLLFLIPYTTTQFIGAARLLEGITDWSYLICLSLTALVVLFYTSMGGMRGALMATAFQGMIMTVAALLIFFGLVAKLGGFETAMLTIRNIDPELISATARGGVATPRYLISFSVLFGFAILGMPHSITSTLIYKNARALHRSIWIGAIAVSIWTIMMMMVGTLTRGLVPELDVVDHAVPTAMRMVLPGFFQGVVLAGIIAAAQSTIAAMLMLMSSSVATEMLVAIRPKTTDSHIKIASQWATVIIGGIVLILAINPPKAMVWLIWYAIAGLESALFAPLLFGLYWKKANRFGALAGLWGGLVGYILVAGYFPKLNFGMNPVVSGVAISLGCFFIANYFGPPPSQKTLETYWGI